jgi:hypothetical protein
MENALTHQDLAPDLPGVAAGKRTKPTAICSYENSRYQTTFWTGREYEDRAERIALTHLLPRAGKRARGARAVVWCVGFSLHVHLALMVW